MRNRFPNPFRNRKIVLVLAGAAILALFLLAISMDGLSFAGGDLFKFKQRLPASDFLKIRNFEQIVLIVIMAFIGISSLALIYSLTKKDLRRHLFQRILQFLILGALFMILAIFGGRKGEEPVTPTPTPLVAPTGVHLPQLPDEGGEQPVAEALPPMPEPPPWVDYLFSLAIVLALGGAAWSLWQRNRKANLQELADIAKAASDDIEAGFDIEDVIMRSYIQMVGVVKKRRGLNRKNAMTPTEFAYWLEGAGLPGEPLHRLTRLFERVRYGAYQSSKEDAGEAVACLREVASFCGEGRS